MWFGAFVFLLIVLIKVVKALLWPQCKCPLCAYRIPNQILKSITLIVLGLILGLKPYNPSAL